MSESVRQASIERAREIVAGRTLGSFSIGDWGPKCAGCGTDEYRIDGYCSTECRDYHDDEHVEELGGIIVSLASALAEAERQRDEAREQGASLIAGAEEREREAVAAAEWQCARAGAAEAALADTRQALRHTRDVAKRAIARLLEVEGTVNSAVLAAGPACQPEEES